MVPTFGGATEPTSPTISSTTLDTSCDAPDNFLGPARLRLDFIAVEDLDFVSCKSDRYGSGSVSPDSTRGCLRYLASLMCLSITLPSGADVVM